MRNCYRHYLSNKEQLRTLAIFIDVQKTRTDNAKHSQIGGKHPFLKR